jgi:quinohemoprotein ethanol dehydrogenase
MFTKPACTRMARLRSAVRAFDAKTGRPLWSYDPLVPRVLGVRGCCDVVNRGVAAWKGKIYVGTFDGRLVALDVGTGKPVWSVMTVDPSKPYTITMAPRVNQLKASIPILWNARLELALRTNSLGPSGSAQTPFDRSD